MTDLQKLVRDRMDELDIPSVKELARRADGLASYQTLRLIYNGHHTGRVSDATVEALALALDLPIDQVYDTAMPALPEADWDWPTRFNRLNQAQRRNVEAHASGYLEAYEQGRRDRWRPSTSWPQYIADVQKNKDLHPTTAPSPPPQEAP